MLTTQLRTENKELATKIGKLEYRIIHLLRSLTDVEAKLEAEAPQPTWSPTGELATFTFLNNHPTESCQLNIGDERGLTLYSVSDVPAGASVGRLILTLHG